MYKYSFAVVIGLLDQIRASRVSPFVECFDVLELDTARIHLKTRLSSFIVKVTPVGKEKKKNDREEE